MLYVFEFVFVFDFRASRVHHRQEGHLPFGAAFAYVAELAEHFPVGIGTEVTGRKYHLFKNDDIVTEKSVTNEEQLKQSRDYLELHKSLFVNPSIRVEDYCGTKYHFADAYSVLEENPEVETLKIALLKNDRCVLPEMFSEEGIKGLKEDAYIFNCQYGE